MRLPAPAAVEGLRFGGRPGRERIQKRLEVGGEEGRKKKLVVSLASRSVSLPPPRPWDGMDGRVGLAGAGAIERRVRGEGGRTR